MPIEIAAIINDVIVDKDGRTKFKLIDETYPKFSYYLTIDNPIPNLDVLIGYKIYAGEYGPISLKIGFDKIVIGERTGYTTFKLRKGRNAF